MYCDILEQIDIDTIDIKAFYDQSDFFSSVFNKIDIPWPASGPLAFKILWDKISTKNIMHYRTFCPVKLWSCITGLHDAYGGKLPEWLIVDPQSFSQSSSVVCSLIIYVKPF